MDRQRTNECWLLTGSVHPPFSFGVPSPWGSGARIQGWACSLVIPFWKCPHTHTWRSAFQLLQLILNLVQLAVTVNSHSVLESK